MKDFLNTLWFIYNGTVMITQRFLSYLFNNWEETLGDEFFLLPLHRGGVVDLHLKYSMKSKMGIRRRTPGYISRTPARKHPSLLFAVLSTRHNLFNPGQMFLMIAAPLVGCPLAQLRAMSSGFEDCVVPCGHDNVGEEDEEVRITSYKRLRKK